MRIIFVLRVMYTPALPTPDQVCLLVSGRPHAFFFDTLKAHRHYTISLDGAGNAGARTGAFTTLQVNFIILSPYRVAFYNCYITQ